MIQAKFVQYSVEIIGKRCVSINLHMAMPFQYALDCPNECQPDIEVEAKYAGNYDILVHECLWRGCCFLTCTGGYADGELAERVILVPKRASDEYRK